jgi:hypothetical protein
MDMEIWGVPKLKKKFSSLPNRFEVTLDVLNREDGRSVINVLYGGVPRESYPVDGPISLAEALHVVAVAMRLDE